YPVPKPEVAVTPGLLVCDVSKPVYFSDNTPGVVSRYWIINGTKDTANTIGYTFSNAGFQPVTLFVTNKYSCNASVTKTVQLYDSIPVGVNAIFTATPSNTRAIFG